MTTLRWATAAWLCLLATPDDAGAQAKYASACDRDGEKIERVLTAARLENRGTRNDHWLIALNTDGARLYGRCVAWSKDAALLTFEATEEAKRITERCAKPADPGDCLPWGKEPQANKAFYEAFKVEVDKALRNPDYSVELGRAALPGEEVEGVPPTPKPVPKPAPPPPAIPLDLVNAIVRAKKDSLKKDSTDCPAAIAYAESSTGLLGEFDKAIGRQQIQRAYQQRITDLKVELLNDTWWERSAGPDVAREVKAVADLIVNIYALFLPAGKLLAAADDATSPAFYSLETVYGSDEGAMLRRFVPAAGEAFGAVSSVGKAEKAIKSAYDSRESVKEAAQSVGATVAEMAAEEAGKRALISMSVGKIFPVYKIVRSLYSRSMAKSGASEFKAVVQEQLRNLDSAFSEAEVKMQADTKAIQAINDLHNSIVRVCAGK